MRNVQTITKEIEELEEKLANVRGTETEVYTRIVGYYRSLRNWNKGKKEEYRHRLPFAATEPVIASPAQQGEANRGEAAAKNYTLEGITGYRYFFRKSCPRCPAVKEFVSRLPLAGTPVDVDTEDGLAQARELDVQSTPTVVFYDAQNKARQRYGSVRQLEEVFANAV